MAWQPKWKARQQEQEIRLILRSPKVWLKNCTCASHCIVAVVVGGRDQEKKRTSFQIWGIRSHRAGCRHCYPSFYRPGLYGLEEGGNFDTPRTLLEIILAKHRNGSLGTVNLRFIGEYTKFEDPGRIGLCGRRFWQPILQQIISMPWSPDHPGSIGETLNETDGFGDTQIPFKT